MAASLDVQASINAVDADAPPGLIFDEGFTATMSYRVTNTGNVVLSNVSVVDDNGTATPDDDIVPAPKLTTQQATGAQLASLELGLADSFLFHPTLPYVYASFPSPENFLNGKVVVFNANTLGVVTTIPFNNTSAQPKQLALSNDGTRLYVNTLQSFSLAVVDTATNSMIYTVPFSGLPYGTQVGADGRLYVSNSAEIKQLSPIDGEEVGPDITLPGHDFYYGKFKVSADQTRLYYASSSSVYSTFNQIDLTTDPPTRLWRHESDSKGLDIAITSDGSYVSFLADPGIDGVTGVPKYRTSDMSLVGEFHTSGIAREMVYSPDGQIAYIASEAGKIGIWDANTFQKLGDITVAGGEPVELQVDVSGKNLFVAVDGPVDTVRVYSTGRNGVHNVGDLNGNQKLDPSEAWTYEAPITTRAGQIVHTATATATTPTATVVSDTDPTHYLVYPSWTAEGTVSENLSGAVIGPIPSNPWPGAWNAADVRFEVFGGNLRLRAGASLSADVDDGLVVDIYTAEATPKRLGRYTLSVLPNELPWHRDTGDPRDVDGNGDILAIDALMIINHLNLVGPGPLGARPAGNNRLIDVDGDGEALAIDALIVINYLNASPVHLGGESPISGEGEAAEANAAASASSPDSAARGDVSLPADWLIALLSEDQSESQKSRRRALASQESSGE